MSFTDETINAATFNHTISVSDGANIGSGSINGGFFGTNAQEVGGNFDFSVNGTEGAGIFIGNE